MYKVIIADDEQAVNDRLVSLFERLKDDFQIVGSYSNGYDALVNGVALEPDLIVTDIKMPYITGIELIRQAKQELPLVQSIIISGYDSFDYAKQAISLGVIGYISKPITFEELQKTLMKAKEELDKKLDFNQSIENLQSQVASGLKIIQDSDFNRLITLKDIPENFRAKLKEDNINLKYKHQLIAIFDVDKDIESVTYEEEESLRFYTDKYIEESFADYKPFYKFMADSTMCVIVLSNEPFKKDELIGKLTFILAQLHKACPVTVSVGISDLDMEKVNYRKLYRHAKRALEFRTVVGNNIVLLFDDLEKPEGKQPSCKVDENEYKAINYELSYGKEEEAKRRIKKIIQTISSPSFKDTYYFILSNILDTILKSCVNLTNFYKAAGSMADLTRRLYSLKGIEEVTDFFMNLVDLIVSINQSSRLSGVEISFFQIKDYIEANYQKYDISLESVAEELGYSISYISAILKKNNTSFTKYLTKIRMDKAKVLLADKESKIINVAAQVGYCDPYYFSHCFKKYFGVSPDEFRKK